MTVSVIVPVYNVERYVADCLNSVRSQTHADLEIIVVDDGSTDTSGSICNEFAALDSRIHVIHRTNGGLSRARNSGLDHATGDQIVFVDGDDHISPDHVASMLDCARTTDADIVMCGLINFEDAAPAYEPTQSFSTLLGREASLEFLCRRARWESCAKLYKAKMFETLRFEPGLLYEDLYIAPRLFALADTVAVLDGVSYGYRQRSGSIMALTRRAPSADLVTVVQSNLNFARKQSNSPEEFSEYLASYALHLTKQLEQLRPFHSRHARMEFAQAYRRFGLRHFRAVVTNRRISLAYRGAWILSVVSPTLFVWLFAGARSTKASLMPGLSRSSRPA
jgi:glycosyltransferase involved in cell wall biosynthesis